MSDRKDPPADFDWRAFTAEDSPKTLPEVRADPRHQALSTPEVEEGGAAYDFSSPIYNFSRGREIITGQHFNLLESAREKPVALIFGSYT
jgi:hypothetical protein